MSSRRVFSLIESFLLFSFHFVCFRCLLNSEMLPGTLIITFFVHGRFSPVSITHWMQRKNLQSPRKLSQDLYSTLSCIPSHPTPTHPNHNTHLKPSPYHPSSHPSLTLPRHPAHPRPTPSPSHIPPSYPSSLPSSVNSPQSPVSLHPGPYTLPYLSTPLPHSLDFLQAAWCHNVINYTPDQ